MQCRSFKPFHAFCLFQKQGGNKNYDSRFGSPVFKTTDIKKKRGFASRHPYFTIFAVSALTLASFWARPVYLMLTTKVTPEDEEKRKQLDEMVSKQLAWTMPIRNTYAEYRKKKEPSQED